MEANDVLLQSAPAEMLVIMRALDAQIAGLRNTMHGVLHGHIEAQGWSTETHDINFNLDSGLFTLTPKVAEEQPA